ncbi:MAG: hypothetical protein CMC21_02075 [Flavobacteriaceae bacterium]|nr:hypothetical protein [Flavobacteriaceae bacterium]|tara:strand:+ start:8956 stop:9252 length:297 start_codon:yes stop_codon:yes gene_type:complete
MADLTILIYLGALLSSVSVVGMAQANGAFSGSLSRTIAGGATSITSATFLVGYTNLESFINACAIGNLGLSGYVFIGGLSALVITWVTNLIEYRKVIL